MLEVSREVNLMNRLRMGHVSTLPGGKLGIFFNDPDG